MARVFYRIAAALTVLFDFGHSTAYPWSDPTWGVDLHPMQSSHFQVLGFNRTYWDFSIGFGLSESVFLILAAVLAWQLGNVPTQAFKLVRLTAWVLVLSFAALLVLNAMYFFVIPIVFSGLIAVFLSAATWLSTRASASST
jgi:hypothetical protein